RWPRDWSSDVCSSDLRGLGEELWLGDRLQPIEIEPRVCCILIRNQAAHAFHCDDARGIGQRGRLRFEYRECRLCATLAGRRLPQIGRASCRERGEASV